MSAFIVDIVKVVMDFHVSGYSRVGMRRAAWSVWIVPLLCLAGGASCVGTGEHLATSGAVAVDVAILLERPPQQCAVAVQPVATTKPRPDSEWLIHPGGVGNIPPDGPFPQSVLALEGKSYHALYFDDIEGKDQFETMSQGHFDQDGFRTIRLNKVDLVIRVSEEGRVMCLYPGATLRTAQGTGIGSTLGQLVHAHGGYTMHRIPEPHHCAVTVPGFDGLAFYFDTCDAACAGSPVRLVYFPGEDPWAEGGE
jgi:hypothetical protein